MHRHPLTALVLASSLLSGCDMIGGALGIESPEKVAAAREAEGKAVGGACRNAARAIEDCFALNKKADKAAVFAGWREMNDYMRENKIEAVAPQVAPQGAQVAQVATTKADAAGDDAPKAAPSADKLADKPAAKADAGKPRARAAKARDS